VTRLIYTVAFEKSQLTWRSESHQTIWRDLVTSHAIVYAVTGGPNCGHAWAGAQAPALLAVATSAARVQMIYHRVQMSFEYGNLLFY
jgi:anti-sigma-K factor RskA